MIKPLGKRILIEVIPPPTSRSGLLLPENSDYLHSIWKGRVLSVGPRAAGLVKEGDVVHFQGVYGRETTTDDKQRIIDVGALLAVESPTE